MNNLRRAVEKKKPSPQQASEKPKKDKPEPKDKTPGQDEFKRTLDQFWGQAFLELRGALAKKDEGDTWE